MNARAFDVTVANPNSDSGGAIPTLLAGQVDQNELIVTLRASKALRVLRSAETNEPALQLGFSGLIPASVASKLTVSVREAKQNEAALDSDAFETLLDLEGGRVLCNLNAKRDVSLSQGSIIELRLRGIDVPPNFRSAAEGWLTVNWASLDSQPVRGSTVKRVRLEGARGRAHFLSAQWVDGRQVVALDRSRELQRELPETFNFRLKTMRAEAGSDWQSMRIRISLSAVESANDPRSGDALCTYEEAQEARFDWNEMLSKAGEHWEITRPGVPNEWTLRPRSKDAFKEGALDLSLQGVRTTLLPGLATVYVDYENAPQFGSGTATLFIEKVNPAPRVDSVEIFTSLPGMASDRALLRWTTRGGHGPKPVRIQTNIQGLLFEPQPADGELHVTSTSAWPVAGTLWVTGQDGRLHARDFDVKTAPPAKP